MAKKAVSGESKESGEGTLTLENFLGEIKEVAYQIYTDRVKRGESGDEVSDWIKAEKKVKTKHKL